MRRKIAVTIPEEIAEQVERAVSEGRAPSVSAFVTTALEEKVGADGKTGRDRLIELLDDMEVPSWSRRRSSRTSGATRAGKRRSRA